jgi:hypothetical protein
MTLSRWPDDVERRIAKLGGPIPVPTSVSDGGPGMAGCTGAGIVGVAPTNKSRPNAGWSVGALLDGSV